MYEGKERRRYSLLSDEQLDLISDKAANKALEKITSEIGKTSLKGVAWFIGIVLTAITTYFIGTHWK